MDQNETYLSGIAKNRDQPSRRVPTTAAELNQELYQRFIINPGRLEVEEEGEATRRRRGRLEDT